jgi:uncharacterized membrane protein (UPF0127 family)
VLKGASGLFWRVVTAALLASCAAVPETGLPPNEVRVVFPAHDLVLVAEIAHAGARDEQARGLGGRDGLPDDHGMIFASDEENRDGLWMKDMRFAIDMLWFDSNLALVDVAENVTPDTYPTIFRPRQPARYALEAPAGFVSRHHIRIGEAIIIEGDLRRTTVPRGRPDA